MEGINFVELVGYLEKPEFKHTAGGIPLFKGTIAVPVVYEDRATGEQKESRSYTKIIAWRDIAETFEGVAENTPLRVQGSIQSRSYDKPCRDCQSPQKTYWTDVKVDAFEILEG